MYPLCAMAFPPKIPYLLSLSQSSRFSDMPIPRSRTVNPLDPLNAPATPMEPPLAPLTSRYPRIRSDIFGRIAEDELRACGLG